MIIKRKKRKTNMIQQNTFLKKISLRCPRCGGFLMESAKRYYDAAPLYKDKKFCINCGRNWRLVKNGKNKYAMELFPFRREWEERLLE